MALYHNGVKPISRGKGHNALAAIGYRAGEKLAHQDVVLCSISAEYAESLEQGNISAELRKDLERKHLFKATIEDWDNLKATPESRKELYQQLQEQFEKSDIELSKNVILSAHRDESTWTLYDKDKRQSYIIERNTPDEFNISRNNGISLSKHATVEESESGWTINDGKKTYHLERGSGDEIDVYGDKIYDYSRKTGVVYKDIFTPDSNNIPEWAKDFQSLGNKIENTEKRKDARLMRENVVGLHRELDLDENKALLETYVKKNFTDKGMIAMVFIHVTDASDKDSVDEDDKRPFAGKNPHAHILLVEREIDGDEFADTKNREWNKTELRLAERESWKELSNACLEDAGSDARIDHRTLAEQGIHDRVAGKHLGKEAHAMKESKRESERATLLQHRTEHYNDVDKFWKASNLSVNEEILLREMQAGYENNQPTLDRTDKFPEIYQIYPEPEQGRGVER